MSVTFYVTFFCVLHARLVIA